MNNDKKSITSTTSTTSITRIRNEGILPRGTRGTLDTRGTLGFTLIEILVVISIIGVLAAFLFSQFSGVRERTRDTQRKSELRQIQSSLELFRADTGCYPSAACTALSAMPACGQAFVANGNTYMATIPCDPTGDAGFGAGASYLYSSSDGFIYTLDACLENDNDLEQTATVTCPAGRVGYRVTNP